MQVRKNSVGISFMEVMITAVALSVGLVGIYRAFFISLDHLDYVTRRLYASNLLSNQIYIAQRNLEISQIAVHGQGQEQHSVFLSKQKIDFLYRATIADVQGVEGVYRLDAEVSWQQGLRPVRITRFAYLLKKDFVQEP